jgi:hypothetical protein
MTAVTALAFLAAMPLALEGLVRRMGLGAIPLLESSAHGGYRMRANQAGRFMRRFAWYYDANGMRNGAVPAGFAGTSLLVGDSVVDGGIRIDQEQSLAALAGRRMGEDFYCVACPGWSFANALAALRALPGWARAKRLIFVLNTGDFDTVARMGNSLSFPTRRPVWLALWLIRRQAYRRFQRFRRVGGEDDEVPKRFVDPQVRASNLADFRDLLNEYQGPVLLVRYPMLGEDARTEPFFEQLAALAPRIRIVEVADAQGWSDDCYADHIHPNAKGLEILARHLCRELT